MSTKMTDAEIDAYLNLTPAEAATVIHKLSTGQRAAYDRLREVGIEAELWALGLGPKPQGVLIDTERSTRRRRAWR